MYNTFESGPQKNTYIYIFPLEALVLQRKK